jgi:hypothetical protein
MSGFADTPGHQRPRRAADTEAVVDSRLLWTGGVTASVVVAGVAMVGFIVVRGLLKIPVLGVKIDGSVILPTMWAYAGWSALATLAFTALLHVLLLTVPRPRFFFGWIGGIATAVAVLVPLTVAASPSVRAATAIVNVAVGASMVIILSVVGSASTRPTNLSD